MDNLQGLFLMTALFVIGFPIGFFLYTGIVHQCQRIGILLRHRKYTKKNSKR